MLLVKLLLVVLLLRVLYTLVAWNTHLGHWLLVRILLIYGHSSKLLGCLIHLLGSYMLLLRVSLLRSAGHCLLRVSLLGSAGHWLLLESLLGSAGHWLLLAYRCVRLLDCVVNIGILVLYGLVGHLLGLLNALF